MKKIFTIFTACAAIAAFSCTKEMDVADSTDKLAGTLTYTATHEVGEADVKTSINMDESGVGKVSWSEGDVIDLVMADAAVYSSDPLSQEEDGKTTVTFGFRGVDEGMNPAMAVYPSGINVAYKSDTLSVAIPAVQDGAFSSAAIEVAKPTDEGKLSFKNVCGLLRVSVNKADVRTITITSNDDSPVVGTVPVSFKDKALSLGEPVATANGVTVNVPGAGIYYVSVLPGINLAKGFYAELKNESGDVIGEALISIPLSVARSQILRLNLSGAAVIGNKVFVTVSGAGTLSGENWENAMDAAGFYELLASENAKDKNIFMAAGTYPTSTTDGVTVNAGTTDLTVYGGYPTDLSGTSLSGRDISTNKTILSGGKDKRILIFNNSKLTATFDGLEFADAYRAQSSAAGMGSAVVVNSCSEIQLLNCVIRDNKNEATTTETAIDKTATGGGAVRAAAGTIIFKGCTFSGNKATVGGGAMRVAGTAKVTLENCTFSGNESLQQNGGAIHMSKGTLTVKDCLFEKNTSKTNGGAISVTQQASCTVNITGTRFIHNRAASKTGYCGGALFAGKWTYDSDISLDHCYFEENMGHERELPADSLKLAINEANASTGGAIFVERNATVKLNHCNFYHNLCSQNGGAIRTKEVTAVLYLNACSFYMNYAGKYASAVQGTSGPIAMYNCVFYNNQNKTGSYPATFRTSGDCLIANTSIRVGSSYSGLVLGTSEKSVLVNSLFVNSGAGSEPILKNAITVSSGKTVSSFGHNLYSGLAAAGDSNSGTVDYTNAIEGSDQAVGLEFFPTWVGIVSGIEYHLLKMTKLPETFYKDPDVDLRAEPSKVEAAIDYFDNQNGTAFKAWLNTLDEDKGRKPLDVDYRSYLRHTDKIWPGSYENGGTK